MEGSRRQPASPRQRSTLLIPLVLTGVVFGQIAPLCHAAQPEPNPDALELIPVCSESTSDWTVTIAQDNTIHEWTRLVVTNNGAGTVVASMTVNDVTYGPFAVSAGNVFMYTFASPILLSPIKHSRGVVWAPDPSKYSYRFRCSGR